MATKLYVGGLAYAVTNDELRDLFASFGEITSAEVIIDRASNRSKGFGFVEMTNDAEAQTAIAELHDKEFVGRRLTVNEARPMEKREPRSGGGGPRRDRNDRNNRRQDHGRRY